MNYHRHFCRTNQYQLIWEKIKGIDYSPEEYVLKGKTIYFYSPHGYGKAKMNNNFFENKLKVTATTRNWKTVNKLADMANNE